MIIGLFGNPLADILLKILTVGVLTTLDGVVAQIAIPEIRDAAIAMVENEIVIFLNNVFITFLLCYIL